MSPLLVVWLRPLAVAALVVLHALHPLLHPWEGGALDAWLASVEPLLLVMAAADR